MILSVNNQIICKPYVKKALQQDIKSGFASISQKAKLEPLEVLVDANISLNNTVRMIPKGALIYILEENLHNVKAYHTKYVANGSAVDENFTIILYQHVVLIDERE